MNFFETLANKFLRLLTISFPEMDHLPAEKRETILKRCAQSPAMGDLLAKIRLIALMPVAVAFPLFFGLLFVWHWAYLPRFVNSCHVLANHCSKDQGLSTARQGRIGEKRRSLI